ncbi:MAG: Ig-like domain-containing protein [Nocardioides sp.]|uniref:Ig-like domain-containing protein n=1 Tax=Nocardioides sp. TaxID=35761 RepID=UPI003265ACCD
MDLREHKLSAALALALGASVLAVAAPAGAATGQLRFSCSGPGFGSEASYPFTAVVDTDLPATLPFGAERITTWTTQVVAPESFRSWAQAQGYTKAYPGARTVTALDGVAQPLLDQQDTLGLAVPATAGAWTWTLPTATTKVPATISGTHAFTFTKLDLTIAFHDATGPKLATSATCVLDPGVPAADAVIDSYDVVAAPTTTSLALKGDMATATVAAAGSAPTGTVTFSVAGKSVSSEVKNGKASAKLPSVPPGTHVVTAAFAPANANQWAASTGTATFVAPRIATTTTATAKFRPARRLIKARASVSAKDRSVVSGRVTFVLKRNGRTIARSTATLNTRSSAAKKFRKVRRTGRYVVVAKYLGTSTYERSQGRVRLS